MSEDPVCELQVCTCMPNSQAHIGRPLADAGRLGAVGGLAVLGLCAI